MKNLKLSTVLLVVSHSVFGMDDCYKDALKFQALAEGGGNDKKESLYNKALDAYVCAAKSGNHYAGYKAVILAKSGQSKALSPKDSDRLIRNAIDANIPDAMMHVVSFNCNSKKKCSNVEETRWLIGKAISLNDARAFNYLGAIYEDGQFGMQNTQMALACYKRGADLGNNLSINNFKRLQKETGDSLQVRDCIVEDVK